MLVRVAPSLPPSCPVHLFSGNDRGKFRQTAQHVKDCLGLPVWHQQHLRFCWDELYQLSPNGLGELPVSQRVEKSHRHARLNLAHGKHSRDGPESDGVRELRGTHVVFCCEDEVKLVKDGRLEVLGRMPGREAQRKAVVWHARSPPSLKKTKKEW
jgi:hypothetical protein